MKTIDRRELLQLGGGALALAGTIWSATSIAV